MPEILGLGVSSIGKIREQQSPPSPTQCWFCSCPWCPCGSQYLCAQEASPACATSELALPRDRTQLCALPEGTALLEPQNSGSRNLSGPSFTLPQSLMAAPTGPHEAQEESARLACLPSPSQWSGSQPALELVSLPMPTSVQPTQLGSSPGPGAPLGADTRESLLPISHIQGPSQEGESLGFSPTGRKGTGPIHSRRGDGRTPQAAHIRANRCTEKAGVVPNIIPNVSKSMILQLR